MDNSISQKKLAELEALLFIHGEPLTLKKIQAVLDVKHEDAARLVEDLKQRLSGEERGLTLVVDEEKIQLATKPQFGKLLEKFIKEELSEDLTPASLETLAAIAYFAPISRARLEYLRGVNSIFILRSLLLRGLVERFSDPERPNAYLYRPTFDLLKHLGVNKREDLPDFGKFQSLMKAFESQADSTGSPQADASPEPPPQTTDN
jgi:segregation and condensation protein B